MPIAQTLSVFEPTPRSMPRKQEARRTTTESRGGPRAATIVAEAQSGLDAADAEAERKVREAKAGARARVDALKAEAGPLTEITSSRANNGLRHDLDVHRPNTLGLRGG